MTRRSPLAVLPLLTALLLVGPGCASNSDPDPQPGTPDAAPADPDTDAGDLLPFMSECETDEQCETGLCFPFNAHGPHCTHECESDLDCEEPSPGCNGKGVCKRPH